MTLVEKWMNDGRAEGRTEGTLTDRREVLARQLDKRFGLTNTERSIIESCEDLDRLAAALDTFVDAYSKDEVLAELR